MAVNANPTLVALSGITKRFKGHRVLNGLSLDIDARDRIALVGSNGAGKTTLIRCLLGEYTHGGDVRVGGVDPRDDRQGVLARIGFVPQLPPPLKLPVRDVLGYAGGVCGVDPADMADVAVRMGLDMDEVNRKPFVKLSGGQKQKLLIGIALGRHCDLYIFDEPTANLDPAARQTLFDLLAERKDKAMIISSHRLEEVAALVNRVIEMDRGKVVLDDRVMDTLDGAARQRCVLRLSRPLEAFAVALGEWGFTSSDQTTWTGNVAGPDRLRFLGTLSRYAGILASIHLDDAGNGGSR